MEQNATSSCGVHPYYVLQAKNVVTAMLEHYMNVTINNLKQNLNTTKQIVLRRFLIRNSQQIVLVLYVLSLLCILKCKLTSTISLKAISAFSR